MPTSLPDQPSGTQLTTSNTVAVARAILSFLLRKIPSLLEIRDYLVYYLFESPKRFFNRIMCVD